MVMAADTYGRLPGRMPVLRAGDVAGPTPRQTLAQAGDLAGPAPRQTMNLALPQPAAPVPVPPLGYTPPTGGPAPTPTPYGTFTAPDQSTFNRSADSLYLQGQQQQALQRSAARHGTLLSGGLLKRLQENAEGLAAQDFQNEYNRQLGTYTTNRDTNAQNFGQQLGSFNAGTSANLGYGRLGLDAAEANRASQVQNAQQQQDYQQQVNNYDAAQSNMGQLNAAEEYVRQVAAARAQNAAAPPMPARPTRRPYSAGPFRKG